MIEMIAAAAGTSLLSGVIQAYNAAEARSASAAELKKLKALIDAVQAPSFDLSKLQPADYEIAAKYNPDVASFIEEQAPELTKANSADAIAGRQAQRSSLQSLMESAQGEDIQSKIEQTRASNVAAQNFRGTQGSILEGARQRGISGSGMELAAQLGASQAAYGEAARSSQDSATNAVQRKLQSLRDAATLGGQIRGEDVAMEGANNSVINSFNERTAARKQTQDNLASNTANEGQRFNAVNTQDIKNKNIAQANTAAVAERARQDELKQLDYTNEIGKVKIQAGVTGDTRKDIIGGAQDTNQTIAGTADGMNTALAWFMKNNQKG